MGDAIRELADFCHAEKIRRFSADEMIELLEEGESVDWILEQVLPVAARDGSAAAGVTTAGNRLRQLLQECAAEVGPPEEAAVEATGVDFEALKGTLPPGVDLGQLKSLMQSPQGALLADFGAYCEERGIDPGSQQSAMGEEMQQLHEEWLQTPRESLDGKRPGEVLEGGRLLPERVETFVREEPKVGRNDPCPCGSGKKYKKCCGKA